MVMLELLVCLVFIIGVALGMVGIYNGLVVARNAFRNAFTQIDVQLQRRFDLIPNLVGVAKQYMAHERETLAAVISARSAAQAGLAAAKANPGDAAAIATLAASQGQLNGVLGRLMLLAEAYPDLKANQNMLQLTEALADTENRLARARQAFNAAVMAYNNRREIFPNSLFAGVLGFQPGALLEIPADQQTQLREAPKLQF